MELLNNWKLFHTYDTHISCAWTEISGFAKSFEITQPVLFKTTGQLNLKHRGIAYSGVVGYAVNVALRYSPTSAGLGSESHGNPPPFIRGACSSGNIYDITDHYGEPTLISQTTLTRPGFYRATVWACAHTTGAPGVNGLIEVNGDAGAAFPIRPYNQFIIDLYDAPDGTPFGTQQFADGGLWP